ncbi:MAG: hypothetical protein R3C59_16935 [Planctomycetaceae bacterium]
MDSLFANGQDENMIAYSKQFAVAAAVVALISCAYLTGRFRTHSDPFSTLTLPTGSASPEGVACDLVRSYISKDADLFHDRRCKVSCENSFDATEAYESLIHYEPVELNPSSPGSAIELKIKSASISSSAAPSADTSLKWDTAPGFSNLERVDLMLTYGAFESKVVDVVARSRTGQEYLFRVQAMQYPKTWDVHNPVPSGIWRGRLIAATVAPSK